MADIIRITNLSVPCVIGVTESERSTPQKIVIDISLWCRLESAVASGNLAATVDYSLLTDSIRRHISLNTYSLLETLAADLVSLCLSFSGLVERVDARVTKPGILGDGGSASVETSRTR